QGCDITVEHDGDIYVIWRDFELSSSKKNYGVTAVRSADGGETFGKPVKVANLPQYTPFDTARDCGDGAEQCPSEFVFSRVPLEPRVTADPTGGLDGIYVAVQQGDPATERPSNTSYNTTGAPDRVSRGIVAIYRSVNNGQTWQGPYTVTDERRGHQFFPDVDALDGQLAVMWQDSREDPAYTIQRPVGNTAGATNSGDYVVNSYVAVSSNGTTFGPDALVSSVGNNPQYEMFASADVPFYGDYNWIDLVRTDAGLSGYTVWTDNRDVVTGPDPREATQDGFDVESGWELQPDGTYTRLFNLGGYDQNIYGNSFTLP
ncbi:MAG: sialidase family protein, partial [Candidatus Nanopelagicales bacterium]